MQQINALSMNRRFDLYEWLRAHKDRIVDKELKKAQVAAEASKALGFPVTVSNVGSLMGRNGRIKYDWPIGGDTGGNVFKNVWARMEKAEDRIAALEERIEAIEDTATRPAVRNGRLAGV